jgi:threonine dehydrogenase-like Zn-dependent dehydrogenase
MRETDNANFPDSMLAWPLYGAGLENLGQNGQPVRWPVPRPAPDQLLVRSNAVGLCYSDVKLIRLGSQHPRLYGRDLRRDPIVQGHEVSLTVVEVGEKLHGRFRPGQRLAMQADVYYHGRNLSYGYMFYGGLAQYGLLGPEILAGDEGCYAIPVPDELGYAEVALTEPWACVEAAYAPRRRVHVKPGGTLWIVGGRTAGTAYRVGEMFAGGWPGRIVLTDVPAALAARFTAEPAAGPSSGASRPAIVIRDGLAPGDYALLAQTEAGGAFDDMILLDPDPARLEALGPLAAYGGIITLAGTRPLGRAVALDVGRAHYDYVTYLGTRSPDLGAAYGEAHNRTDVRAGGVAWLVGAGGPMGRMHLQRLLEAPEGPRRIVVAETNAGRRAELELGFRAAATIKGVDLVITNPRELSAAEFDDTLRALHGGRGFDDIVVMVANVAVIEAAMPHLAGDGLLVLFAGLARGTIAQLDISNVYLGNTQITGSAGSRIVDQAAVIARVAAGHLSTARAVSAIGGLSAAHAGIEALMEGRFPGKIVIFPPVVDFSLTPLADLKTVAPAVYERLGPGETWTRSAEAEFLRLCGRGDCA